MGNKDYKAVIVEGKEREPRIIDNIAKVFFAHGNVKIITLPSEQNIYMLWKKLKEDDFDTDIIEVLRENHQNMEEQLEGLSRDDFSEVYLFFDFDVQQENLSKDDDDDILNKMLKSFDNETENGKLYISYPMVEALRDFQADVCGNKDNCYAMVTELEEYKAITANRTVHTQFEKYDFEIWKEIIDVFMMRLSCLMNQINVIKYDKYAEVINPREIHKAEERELQKNRVFILSAFPEFLLDYFGEKLWRKCVKHTKNQLDKCGC